MKRIAASLLLTAGLLFGSTIAHPASPARADAFYCDSAPAFVVAEVLTFGFGVLGCVGGELQGVQYVPPSSCPLVLNVDVSGTASKHVYNYHFKCGDGADVTVQAHFDVTSLGGVGEETLTSTSGTATAHWACQEDPWISSRSAEQLDCVGGLLSLTPGGPDPEHINIDNIYSGPLSVSVLSDFSRQTLAAQLQNALNQKPAGPATSPLGHAIGTKISETCFACPGGPASNLPAQPDLSLSIAGKTSLYNGMTTPYTITIKNQGALLSGDPVVQVAIAFNGNLQYYATGDTGAFTCTPGATINCTGHLDSSGQATLIFQGYAKAAGSGTVQATVDPSQAIPDSNRSNNTQTLNVTIS